MSRFKHDVPTLIGTGVVAIAAAVLSFASLQALAERAGYAPGLAALLPLAIDAQAVVATRAWLAAGTPEKARAYARRLALTAVALSVVGNAGEHAMSAAAVVAPWWVVVLIASVPPIALAATAHLGALLATGTTGDGGQQSPVAERPAESAGDPVQAVDPASQAPQVPRARRAPAKRQRRAGGPPSRSMDELRAEFAAAIDGARLDPASAESIRRALRCSPTRARQLRDEHARPHLAVVNEQA